MTHKETAARLADALEPVSAYGRVGTRDVDQAVVQQAVQLLRQWPEAGEPVAWLDEGIDTAYTAKELDGGTADGLKPLYAALSQQPAPESDVVVSKDEQGQIVAVTRQDEEGRILSVIAKSAQAAQSGMVPEDDFATWLAREMPPGTIISDPQWWAPKIRRALVAAPQAVPFDRTTALVLLQAASKSGDPGAISLAAQLAGAAPCKDCGYVNFKCRCAKTAPQAVPRRVRKIGGSFQHTGTVVAQFTTTAGEPRIVLEFDAPVAGMLHVYRPDQVEPALDAPQAVPQPEPDWLHLKRYGYAPGNYMNRCHACEAMFSDLDKRASTCRPCAEQLHARAHGITAKGEQP